MIEQAPVSDPAQRQLTNRGLHCVNEAAVESTATLVAVGVARGGTSLVAGVLDAIGLFLGDEASAPDLGDRRLGRALGDTDPAAIARVVADYDRRHRRWGLAGAGAVHDLERLHAQLRNPRYLIVFRDLFSIARRNRASIPGDVIQGMREALADYRGVIDFVEQHRPPALLVSYDKALRDSTAFVDAVIQFAGDDVDATARARALAFVAADPLAGIDPSRSDGVVGHVDAVLPREVVGWAAPTDARGPDRGPLAVELWVNGRQLMTGLADLHRADLRAAGAHPSGDAGYRFVLPEGAALRPGDRVQVFAGAGRAELANSPWTLAAATPTA